MAWQKDVAQTVMVTFYKAGVPTTPTGALTATISQNGGAFGAIAGTVVLVAGTPVALLSLAAGDTNCDAGVVLIVDGGGSVDPRYVEFVTESAYTAAVAATAGAAASATDVAEIGADADELIATIGAAGAGLTSIPDSTTITEISADTDEILANQTAAMGAGFDTTTDSQVALAAEVAAFVPTVGDHMVTITVTDGTLVYPGVKVTLQNTTETAVPLVAFTDSSGQVSWSRNQSTTWKAIAASSGAQSGGTTTFTVAGATAVTVTVAANPLPSPASPACWVLWNRDTQDAGVGTFAAGDLVATVTAISAQYSVGRDIIGKPCACDSSGAWQIEIDEALDGAVLTITETWNKAVSGQGTRRWQVTIDGTKAVSGQIPFTAVSPRSC